MIPSVKQLSILPFCLLFSLSEIPSSPLINAAGNTIESRVNTVSGDKRIVVPSNSFAAYLRKLPVYEPGHTVKYFNGESKRYKVYDAVLKTDVGNTDLQQCADAVMRLRAEYLLSQKRYKEINFNFTNGFSASYAKWRTGYRIVTGNNGTRWVKTNEESESYASFRKYLDQVFMYAGTLSLSKQLKSKNLADVLPGDVFIKGGSPGHAVLVVDVAVDNAGNKKFMLAQSYMPAQEIHILKNFNQLLQSPWYSVNGLKKLETPEWTFTIDQLKTW